MYFASNSSLILFAGGITMWFRAALNRNIKVAEIKYGYSILIKLTPLDSIAMISVLYAILDVKNITVMKTKSELNVLRKNGIKVK
jgi:hypothetical protein